MSDSIPGISSFGELCTRLRLFQPNPGPGYRLLDHDERLRDGDEGVCAYECSSWSRTGFKTFTVAEAQEMLRFLPGHLQTTAFRRAIS